MAKAPGNASASQPARTGVSQPANASGATINSQYLERTQEIVAVNRSDLEDLLAYDTDSIAFFGFGSFLMSGSVWLLAEQVFGDNGVLVDGKLQMNALTWVCVGALAFGAIMMVFGLRQHSRKRNKINRIFHETRPVQSTTPQQGTTPSRRSAVS